jgi:hypothetical protein
MMPLQAARPMPAVELEAVPPTLLLPPVQPRGSVAAALAGGPFELGDRVLSLRAKGEGPPFGLRGTVRSLIIFGENFMLWATARCWHWLTEKAEAACRTLIVITVWLIGWEKQLLPNVYL